MKYQKSAIPYLLFLGLLLFGLPILDNQVEESLGIEIKVIQGENRGMIVDGMQDTDQLITQIVQPDNLPN